MQKIISKENFYIAYTVGMTNYLIRKGFDLLKAEDSKKDPQFKTFFFERTPELEEEAKKYIETRRRK